MDRDPTGIGRLMARAASIVQVLLLKRIQSLLTELFIEIVRLSPSFPVLLLLE
jgi:hypothetical protein